MAHIYQRGKKGIWWIKYYVNGRQVFHSLHTDQQRVASKIKRQIEGEEAKGELLAPSQTPLPAFLQDYCQFLITIRTRKSYKNDISFLRIFFGPISPALELGSCVNKRWDGQAKPVKDTKAKLHVKAECLEEITAGRIEEFLSRRIREEKIAPKTANRFREVLHRLFNYAAKNWNFVAPDRCHPNPAAVVERRREPAHSIRFLTQAEIDQQLQVLSAKTTLRAAVAALIYGGFRREEVLWLTMEDVDLARRLIHVRAKTIDGQFWQPKTKRNRVVPISTTLLGVLQAYAPKRKGPWYFPSPTGGRWDPDNFSQDLRAVNDEHQLDWSCLDYRHTFGSHLAQKGESLYKIATLMGNSPEICRRHYAALVPEAMHDVVEFMPTPMKPKGQSEQTEILLKQLLDRLGPQVPQQATLRLVR